MDRIQALTILRQWDAQSKYVFTKHELTKVFQEEKAKTLNESLSRFVKAGFLQRACRGVYIYLHARTMDSYTLERIAVALRRGEYNYISLESMLSEYGVISQIPMNRLTVMTTGRKGIYETPYGTIEFTHTKRTVSEILEGVLAIKGRPLRIAKKNIAYRDLKRVGRNTNMVNLQELNDD